VNNLYKLYISQSQRITQHFLLDVMAGSTNSSSSPEAVPDELPNAFENLSVQAALKPLSHFHLFPNLPTELRLQIWRSAFPPPRIVETRSLSSTLTNHDGPLRRAVKLPIVLKINRESREETLKHYTLIPRSQNGSEFQAGVFCFNSKRDVLHIYRHPFFFGEDPVRDIGIDYQNSLNSVRMLEISISSNFEFMFSFKRIQHMFVTRLNRLEKIYVTHPPWLKDFPFHWFQKGPWSVNRDRNSNAWIDDFREFLWEYRDNFYGGKAPVVTFGASDALGRRDRRPKPGVGDHGHGLCRCTRR